MAGKQEFEPKELSKDDLEFCNRVLSSEALAGIVLDKIARGEGGSIVRMADGEKAIIDVSKGHPPRHFLKNINWLKEYGVADMGLQETGDSLIWAGIHADYLAIAISGLYRPSYRLHPYFLEHRDQFIDQFYHRIWWDRGRLTPILQSGKIIVVHRFARDVANKLQQSYELPETPDYVSVSSYADHADVEKTVAESDAKLVLVSAGPTGKAMIVRMAQRRPDQWVMDVGGAMTKVWCR